MEVHVAFEYGRNYDTDAKILGAYTTKELATKAVVAHIKRVAPDFEVIKLPGTFDISDRAFIDEYLDVYCRNESAIEIHAVKVERK